MEDPSSTFTFALNHIKQCNNAKKISRCKGIHWGDSKNITEETKKCNFSPLMLLLLRLMLMMMTMMGKPQWKTAGHTMQWPVSLPNRAFVYFCIFTFFLTFLYFSILVHILFVHLYFLVVFG